MTPTRIVSPIIVVSSCHCAVSTNSKADMFVVDEGQAEGVRTTKMGVRQSVGVRV